MDLQSFVRFSNEKFYQNPSKGFRSEKWGLTSRQAWSFLQDFYSLPMSPKDVQCLTPRKDNLMFF